MATDKADYMRRYRKGEITLTRPQVTLGEAKEIQELTRRGRLSVGEIARLMGRSRDTVRRYRDGLTPQVRKRPTIYDDQGKNLPGPKPYKCMCEEFGCFTCMGRELSRITRQRGRERGVTYNYHPKAQPPKEERC